MARHAQEQAAVDYRTGTTRPLLLARSRARVVEYSRLLAVAVAADVAVAARTSIVIPRSPERYRLLCSLGPVAGPQSTDAMIGIPQSFLLFITAFTNVSRRMNELNWIEALHCAALQCTTRHDTTLSNIALVSSSTSAELVLVSALSFALRRI